MNFTRNWRMALAGLALLAGQLAQAGEAQWRQLERAARGDLSRMMRIVDEAPEVPQPRIARSAAATAEALRRAGRFRELGLSEEEGARLVAHVYRKLGVPLAGEPRGHDLRSEESAMRPAAPALMRAATEFERLSSILIRWPFDWPALTDEYVALVRAFANGGVSVQIWVDTRRQRQQAEQLLGEQGVPLDSVQWRVENTDSIWMRDYGPQFLKATNGAGGAVVDFHYYRYRPNDDDTPGEFAAAAGLPVVDRQSNDVVYTEGGNLMHDGLGSVIYSQRTYLRNRASAATVDQRLLSAFQASQGIVLRDMTLDSTGHVDMFLKVLDESTVLVGQYAPDQPDYAILEEAAAGLSQWRNGAGRKWRVIRIPQPDVYYTHFVVPVVRTYTNAQMVNNVVVVPVYGVPGDAEALAIYRKALPGRQIVGIDANDIIESGGAWHCVAMEMPLMQ